MAMDTFVVFAASYDTLGAAEADYHAVRGFYLASGLLLGATGGAGLGALAAHVSAGLKRADHKDLGELLDERHSGLVVVAASDLGDRVQHLMKRASKVTSKHLQADEAAAARDIESAAGPDQDGP
jgi:uncharacterized membrane protein